MQPSPDLAILMPDIGPGCWRVEVCSWLAEPGEIIREGDRLVEVSLPGITFDVSAPVDGRLISIEKSIGAEVQPGDVLGQIIPIEND